MRLYRYLSMSSDNDEVNTFRSLSLHLVEEDTGNVNIIKRLSEDRLLDDSALMLLERANRELKRLYRGKLKFDYCVEGEGIMPDELKIDDRKVKTIKEKWFRFNDELSSIQSELESNLRKSLQNK